MRYDVKGRHDIGTPYKFCFEDVGVRNVASDFRDLDETDIIENIVFHELQARGFRVVVGVVEAKAKTPQKDENSNPSYQGKPTRWIFATRIDAQRKKSQEYESIRHTPIRLKSHRRERARQPFLRGRRLPASQLARFLSE